MSEREHESTHAVTTETEPNAPVQAQRGRGEMLVHGLLARGRPQPREVAQLIAQHPDDRSAIIGALHQTMGNSFVGQVLSFGPDHDQEEDHEGEHGHEHAPVLDEKTVAQPSAKTDPVDDLLKKVPTQTKGVDGYAAWLLTAKDLGFIASSAATLSELGDLRDNKQEVRTKEKEPGKKIEEKKREIDKTLKKPKLDRVTKVGEGKTYEGYDVGVDESSILKTLVELARTRIQAWKTSGATKKRIVLDLGDFVRGDAGFGGSPHTGGDAMDLFFLGGKNTAGDVIDLLQDLPAGPTLVIVRDSNNALHLDRLGGRYGLGVPSMGDYLPPELDIEKTKAAAIAAAGNDHTQKIEATGIEWGDGWVRKYTGTWNEKYKTWVWSATSTVELAENKIQSAPLRDAIADYRKRSKTGANAPTNAPPKPHQHKHGHESEHR